MRGVRAGHMCSVRGIDENQNKTTRETKININKCKTQFYIPPHRSAANYWLPIMMMMFVLVNEERETIRIVKYYATEYKIMIMRNFRHDRGERLVGKGRNSTSPQYHP